MDTNLILDKCCKILNQKLCSHSLESYTVSWNHDLKAWQFDLKIRGREPESIQLPHREMCDAMVGAFAMIFQELMR